MLMKLLGCCFGASHHEGSLDEMLKPHSVSILSASCCDASAAPKEQALKRNVAEAMRRLKQQGSIHIETITGAQKGLRNLAGELASDQRRLVETVTQLFQTEGLTVFPMLIVDGRVVYYGGVPSVDMIEEKLRSRAQAPVQQAVSVHG